MRDLPQTALRSRKLFGHQQAKRRFASGERVVIRSVTGIRYRNQGYVTGCVAAVQVVFLANMRERLEKIIRERDAGAFKSLFTTFGPKVRAMLLRQGADSETAEDIVQDTMLTVWSKPHLYAEEKGALSTWIYTIARNLRTDRVRRQVVWDKLRDDIAAVQTAHDTARTALWGDQDRLHVANALSGLPNDQLQVVKLSFIDGLSQTEIAEKLDLPLGTVKSRMRLAFDKLRCSVGGGP